MKTRTIVLISVGSGVALLLAWVLVPIPRPRRTGTGINHKVMFRIIELSTGAESYARDNQNLYPGQYYDSLLGKGPDKMTGSQMLARSVLGSDDPNLATGLYASFSKNDIIFVNARPAVSDRWPERPMPVCYYPARLGDSGLTQFHEEDNAAITDGHKGGDFRKMIADPRRQLPDGTSKPYNSGTYLLIAPGPDRLYFTADDIRNFGN